MVAPLNTSLSCLPSLYPLDWSTLHILSGVSEFNFYWEDPSLWMLSPPQHPHTQPPGPQSQGYLPTSYWGDPFPLSPLRAPQSSHLSPQIVVIFLPTPPLQTRVSRADFQQITASLMSLYNEQKPKLIFWLHCNWACYQAQQKYIPELVAYPAFTDPVSICTTDSTPCTPVACPANFYSAQLLQCKRTLTIQYLTPGRNPHMLFIILQICPGTNTTRKNMIYTLSQEAHPHSIDPCSTVAQGKSQITSTSPNCIYCESSALGPLHICGSP